MNSLFVHLKSVRDVFFDYNYHGYFSTNFLSNSFIKLLLVFDLRQRVLLIRSLNSKYFQICSGDHYLLMFDDIYDRLLIYLLSIFYIPLGESFSSTCFSYFRPFRNNFDLFSSIKNSLFLNFRLFNTVFSFRFTLYFSSLIFSYTVFYKDDYFSKFFLRFFDFYFSYFSVNVVYFFYSFIFYGLLISRSFNSIKTDFISKLFLLLFY